MSQKSTSVFGSMSDFFDWGMGAFGKYKQIDLYDDALRMKRDVEMAKHKPPISSNHIVDLAKVNMKLWWGVAVALIVGLVAFKLVRK